MGYKVEVFHDATSERVGAFMFDSKPEMDMHISIGGSDYTIVGVTDLRSSGSEFDYEVDLMKDDYDFDDVEVY